jgi:hypothetical protein
LLKLALRQRRLIAQALELLRVRALGRGLRVLLDRQSAGIRIEFDRRQRREEGLHDLRIHGIRGNILANRNPVLLTEMVAEIARPTLVLHD